MQGHQGTEVELWLFQQLNLSDVDVLQWEDVLGSVLDLLVDDFWDQLGGELGQGGVLDLSGQDLGDHLSDGSDVRRLSVTSLLDLVWLSSGEGNGEHSQDVLVSSLDGDVSLDQSLPLSNHGSVLVGGEVQTVEVGQQVLALDFVDSQLDLSERVVLRALQVR